MGKFSGRPLSVLREDISLVLVDHAWVWKYRKLSGREGVSVKVSEAGAKRHRWWRTGGSEAFIGSLAFNGGHARMKGLYVFPEWRGEGIGHTTSRRLFDLLVEEGATKISRFGSNPKIFEAVGFKLIREPNPESNPGSFYMEWVK